MPPTGKTTGATGNPVDARRDGGTEPPGQLLRSCHIFSAVVDEVLDGELLSQARAPKLHRSQLRALRLIDHDQIDAIGDVATLLGVSAAAVTKSIDKLERLRLVARAASHDDRRVTHLRATRQGRKLLKRCSDIENARLHAAEAVMTPSQLKLLTELLRRFSVALLDQLQTTNHHCLRCAGHLQAGCPIAALRGDCPLQRHRGDPRSVGQPKPE